MNGFVLVHDWSKILTIVRPHRILSRVFSTVPIEVEMHLIASRNIKTSRIKCTCRTVVWFLSTPLIMNVGIKRERESPNYLLCLNSDVCYSEEIEKRKQKMTWSKIVSTTVGFKGKITFYQPVQVRARLYAQHASCFLRVIVFYFWYLLWVLCNWNVVGLMQLCAIVHCEKLL